MKKKIWILNHYAGNMLSDKNGRHYNFAKYLRKAGYEPIIFCCNAKHGVPEYFYPVEDLWQEKMAQEIDTPFIFVQGRTYSGNGKQRILNMMDFYFNVKKACKIYAAKYGKPDVIYASSVHPLTLVAGEQLAKYYGVKCICEIRDLWPESIVCYKGMSRKNPVICALYQLEKWMYKHADRLIFTMEGGYDYIEERGWDKIIPQNKIVHINNGVDLDEFNRNKRCYTISDPNLEDNTLFKVIYTGSIREVNGLRLLVDVAKEMSQYKDIIFLVYGDGSDRSQLEQCCKNEGINNVLFKGKVEKRYIPYITSCASLNYINVKQTDIMRFGCSLNKLFDYLAAGKPIVSNLHVGYDVILKFSCGIVTVDQTAQNVSKAILEIRSWSNEKYNNCCKNAHLAVQEYDFQKLTEKLKTVIEGVLPDECLHSCGSKAAIY